MPKLDLSKLVRYNIEDTEEVVLNEGVTERTLNATCQMSSNSRYNIPYANRRIELRFDSPESQHPLMKTQMLNNNLSDFFNSKPREDLENSYYKK